jgi:predicted ArsR family transcriptional regulator
MAAMLPLELIADPIRLRIVRRLASGGPAGLNELAAAAEVHLNTIRPHLAALEEAGVVVRERGAPAGRGQPPAIYRLAPGYALPTADFRGLAELLAAAILRGARRPEELRALGREWGRFLLGRPGKHSIASELPAALERLGFEARVAKGKVHLALCPCPLVAPEKPALVCGLVTAVIEGFLAGSGSELTVGECAHDPLRRSCIVALRPLGGAAALEKKPRA